MFRHRTALLVALLASAAPLLARPVLAAWSNQPGVNLRICTAVNSQQSPVIVSDGASGAIITWQDARGATVDIYSQHVLPTGIVDPAWPVDGRAVCTAIGGQLGPVITTDGGSGAIIAWNDLRGGATADIYAQHVLGSGVVDPAWPVNGRALCSAANGQFFQVIVSDGAGGAIVAWGDQRTNGVSIDIYAQHVLASGAVDPAWPVDGRALCTAVSDQYQPTIASDGAGGAIVTWYDLRGGLTSDIYAQHVLASGAVDPAWPVDGRGVCTAATSQQNPVIVPDGSGGAIIAWYDSRNGPIDLYAQHLMASGAVDASWPSDGRPLCNAAGAQSSAMIISDGVGGAIVTWQDPRTGAVDIYAQHVLPSGTVDPAWPVDGLAVSTAANDQLSPTITTDGAAPGGGGSGAIITWYDSRAGFNIYDVYAQHVLISGGVDPLWPADGRAISTAAGTQQFPVIASDGTGGAIITWYDQRSGSPFDIYAQRVARFGYLGTPEAEITGARDIPNDNGGKLKLSWNASWLDLADDPNVTWYEIYRSVPPNFVTAARARGAHVLADFAEVPAPGAETVVAQAQGYAWEFVETQYAVHYLASYSYVAATVEDSTGYQNPKTAFMIVARNGDGSKYWLSRPDSGYSVDNLPPLPPSPFAGQYSAGVAHLHWRANSEFDLANYRVYRGHSAGFTPAESNRIATPTDTLLDDAAGSPYYYKLSAVDIHGNESGFTSLLPEGTLDVQPGALTSELALEPSTPNPASVHSTLSYSTPREARVRLTVYDASGRLIRRLADDVEPAGRHQATWDLRDDAGQPVGAGLYFVRLQWEGRSLVRRMTAAL